MPRGLVNALRTRTICRAMPRPDGLTIGPNDLLIAAICRNNDLTLVTSNVGEFGRVSGLKIEDWTS